METAGGSGSGGRRRNADRRREKSMYAARDRRGREAEIFAELEMEVPQCDEATVTHVDRIALLRLAAAHCRLRGDLGRLIPGALLDRIGPQLDEEEAALILPGFLCLLGPDGRIAYISRGVAALLGLTQTDLMGQSLGDFADAGDLGALETALAKSGEATACLRLKSVLTPRGRNLNLRSAALRSLKCSARALGGYILMLLEPLAATATAAQQAVLDVGDTFVTRHAADFAFAQVPERAARWLGYESRALIGRSFFAHVHPGDVKPLGAALKELTSKGQLKTPYYRLVKADGESLWVETELSASAQRGKPGSVSIVACHRWLGSGDADAASRCFRARGRRVCPAPVSPERQRPPPLRHLAAELKPGAGPDAAHAASPASPAALGGVAGGAALRPALSPDSDGGEGGPFDDDELRGLADSPDAFRRIRSWLLEDYSPPAGGDGAGNGRQSGDGDDDGALLLGVRVGGEGGGDPPPASAYPAHTSLSCALGGGGPARHVAEHDRHAPGHPGTPGVLSPAGTYRPPPLHLPPQVLPGHDGELLAGARLPQHPERDRLQPPLSPSSPPPVLWTPPGPHRPALAHSDRLLLPALARLAESAQRPSAAAGPANRSRPGYGLLAQPFAAAGHRSVGPPPLVTGSGMLLKTGRIGVSLADAEALAPFCPNEPDALTHPPELDISWLSEAPPPLSACCFARP